MTKPWPFDQPENCAVISLRRIVHERAPILLVTHDEEDHGWQFLDGSEAPDPKDAVLVCLSHMVEWDPSLLELADLPPGWLAWRESANGPWLREQNPEPEEE